MDFASVLEAGGSLALSIGVFAFAVWLNRKTNSPLLNPLLVTVAIIMIGLTVFNIPLDSYEKGATLISSMLGPATAVLAFSIYQQRKILQSNFLPIFIGCLVGSTVSMVSAYGLCELFGLGDQVALSTLPKSTTAPIALAVTGELGGTASITMAAVMTTGVMGAIFSPMLANLFHIKNKVAQGVAIGTCSHAVGTAKALEMGKRVWALRLRPSRWLLAAWRVQVARLSSPSRLMQLPAPKPRRSSCRHSTRNTSIARRISAIDATVPACRAILRQKMRLPCRMGTT